MTKDSEATASTPTPIQRYELVQRTIMGDQNIGEMEPDSYSGDYVLYSDHLAAMAAKDAELAARDAEIARLQEIEKRAKALVGEIIRVGEDEGWVAPDNEFDALVNVLAPLPQPPKETT